MAEMLFDIKCEFCLELQKGGIFYGEHLLPNRYLYTTKYFLVFPTLGHFVDGYLLIIPKTHYLSMAQLPAFLHNDLEAVQSQVRSVLTKRYCAPIFFEHGSSYCKNIRGGNCIDHAHIHCMPIQIDIIAFISQEFSLKSIRTYSDLRKFAQHNEPYIFIETQDGKRYAFYLKKTITSQYLRKIIAEQIGKHDQWDWAVYPFITAMKRTYKELKSEFL